MNRWNKTFLAMALFFLVGMIIFSFTLGQIPDDLNKIALSNPTTLYADEGQVFKVMADRQVVDIQNISPFFLRLYLSTGSLPLSFIFV